MANFNIKRWSSSCSPSSLINISTDAVATQSNGTICCINLKKKTTVSYNATTLQKGCGVSLMAGHSILSVFAFAEEVVRPNIFVLSYPSFSLIGQFKSPDVITYKDLCFTKGDHLIALSSCPNYTIRVLNFRNNDILIEMNTFIECEYASLLCSHFYLPTICQYSKIRNKLYFYDLCYQTNGYILPHISTIAVDHDQNLSTKYNKCFAEDNNLYMVNDFGDLIKADIGLFDSRVVWHMPSDLGDIEEIRKPRSYILQYSRRGMLIANPECIYLVKQVESKWQEELKIQNIRFPIVKIVADLNGDMFMTDSMCDLYMFDVVENEGVLTPLGTKQFQVNKFAVLNGIREEAILILTQEQELFLLDLNKKMKLSEIKIDGIVHMSTHNAKSYAVVGNEKGELYIISYVRFREPSVLITMDLDTPKIKAIKIFDELVVVLDVFESIIIIHANFDNSLFYQKAHIVKPIEKMSILDFFVISQFQVIILYTLEPDDYWPHANLMCIYDWSANDNTLRVQYHELPFDYVSFTLARPSENNVLELYSARARDVIIDVFTMNIGNNSWSYTDSFQTGHHCFLHSITLSHSLITSSIYGTYISFHTHPKSKRVFGITKFLEQKFAPSLPKYVEECFASKYLITLYMDKSLLIQNPKNLTMDLKENICLPIPPELSILQITSVNEYPLQINNLVTKVEPTAAELNKREEIKKRISHLAEEVYELIEYDIEIAGITKGMFRKFCLNLDWLDNLTTEAETLCNVEIASVLKATEDQCRIRDWIFKTIFAGTEKLSSRVRALFTNVYCENYSKQIFNPKAKTEFDLFRFHDFEIPENELEKLLRESHMNNSAEDLEEEEPQKRRKLYDVTGGNVFEHIMSEELFMQSKDEISYFQLHNTWTKFKIALNDPLISEFNKLFDETVDLKHQIIEHIFSTNDVLKQIYSNMNIMRRLLIMDYFTPPELSVPEWTNDEDLDKILTVDDSEIKAINRRKKKAEMAAAKSGRMLLWALEFWERALRIMMDGVLEKLWEEEIKKDIPVPEFISKKDPHQFSLTEQKQYREYLEKVRILELDRRKYLVILRNNEFKTHNLKKGFILKFNTKITEMAILKLQYDFALKRCILQLLNTKIIHFKRLQYGVTLNLLKEDFAKTAEYIYKYGKFCTHWEKSVLDVKSKLQFLQNKERTIDRNFRTFINLVPPQFAPDLRKLFRKMPKLNKQILSVLMCDILSKLLQHKIPKEFPIPQAANEFMIALDELDSLTNMPNQLEQKQWDIYVKLRRQKISNLLIVKAWNLRLMDVQNTYMRHSNNLNDLHIVRNTCTNSLAQTRNEYKGFLKNRTLVVTLTSGQLEVNFSPTSKGFQSSLLMHIDDILKVNASIKAAGLKKIRAMQRVAVFRRQVIAREWDHEVTKANIAYLNYMLNAIEKTKVTKEFLEVLYKWNKINQTRKSTQAAVGIIEQKIEVKIKGANARLDRYIEKIDKIRKDIAEVKTKNNVINKNIDNLKINYALSSVYLDDLAEEKRIRDQSVRMDKIKAHQRLLIKVREDYAKILELKTILEIQRLRTCPNLEPAAPECSGVTGDIIL